MLLADVAENVVDARDHLIAGQGERVDGVEHREAGHDAFIGEHMPDLELLRRVGDDGARVHLAARADHRQNAADGNDLAVGLLETEIVFLPRVFGAMDGDGERLRIVAHRTAAHGKEQVCLVRAGNFHAFAQLVVSGVGHDARDLRDVLSALFEDSGDRVIDAVLLDGAAAVDEHDVLAVFGKFLLQVLDGAFAEIELGRIAVGKVSEHKCSSRFFMIFADTLSADIV